MTRYLKTLGLALVAAFAFSAVAASAASAVNHHVDGVKGDKIEEVSTQETTQTFESTTGENKGFTCHDIGANGEVEADTATSVTVEPEFFNCTYFEGETEGVAKVEVNGCHFTFTGETTAGNPTGGEHANVHLGCPPESPGITIRVTALNLKCSLVPPQTVKHAVRYDDLGNGQITVTATAHGIRSITEEGIACGPEEEHTNGSYTGTALVTATPNGLSLSTTPEA